MHCVEGSHSESNKLRVESIVTSLVDCEITMDKFVDSFSRGSKKQKLTQTKPKKNVSTQPSQQMYLDLGQKLFGKSMECASCGMLYVIGDVDDERRHDQNCAKVFIIDLRHRNASSTRFSLLLSS